MTTLYSRTLLLTLALCLGAPLARAAPAAADPCALVQAAELRLLGLAAATPPTANHVDLDAAQTGAPAALAADLCFWYDARRGNRYAVNLTLETYASDAGLAAWLDRQSRSPEAGAIVTRHGATTCERASYDAGNGTGARRLQHVVSCDQLVGARRIALTVEAAEGPAALPPAGRVAGVLQLVLERRASKATY